ncbi:MAG: cyclic nucleotide-binding domain-containing protein, partial [Steroidobacteraceae bacterium]
MNSAGVPIRKLGNELWPELSGFDLFSSFSAEQRDAFLRAFDSEAAMRLRQFRRGELICGKGEFELDLCFVLKGGVNLFEVYGSTGRTKVAERGAGSFYGEMGALGGLPRTLDIVAAEDGTEIFYVPRHCLKFVETNDEARAILSARYRERAIRVMVTELELFKGVEGEFIDRLLANCEIKHYDQRGIVLVKQGEVGDSLYVVRDGYVQIVREREDGTRRVLAYRRAGEYFGEMSLLGGGGVRNASVLTAGKCEVIKIRGEDVAALIQQFPAAEAQVRATIERRLEAEKRLTPELSAILKESGQFGVIQADALLVMDLDLCVKCDNCVKACESLHGTSRRIRTGIHLGKYLVPAACRHCDDPKCMNSCPTGAIKRRSEGEIYFQYDMCIGCGNCKIACPYDNIAMIETNKFDAAQDRKAETLGKEFFRPYPVASHAVEHNLWNRIFAINEHGGPERLDANLLQRILGRNQASGQQAEPRTESGPKSVTHVPAAYPIKCDLCDGLPFMGCVHACPTGSAMRIKPSDLFPETMGAVIPGPDRVRKVLG